MTAYVITSGTGWTRLTNWCRASLITLTITIRFYYRKHFYSKEYQNYDQNRHHDNKNFQLVFLLS